MYLNLLIISLIIVFVIDLTDFFPTIGKSIYKWITGKKQPDYFNWDDVSIFLHPLSCSLCATFWVCLLYIIITDFTILNLGYITLLAFTTTIQKDFLILFKDMITKLLDAIYKILKLNS